MSPLNIGRWILILGLAFVFGYFGIEKFIQPLNWIGWMPKWMDGLLGMGINAWLSIIGAGEIAIAIGLLIPIRLIQQIASVLAALHLAGILTQIGWNDVAIRDIGLLAIAIAIPFLLSVRREER